MPARFFPSGVRRPACAVLFAVLLLVVALPARAPACPFCKAQQPTLCQRQEGAVATALGEVESLDPNGQTHVILHQMLSGLKHFGRAKSLSARLELAVQPGTLVLLFGSPTDDADPEGFSPEALEWQATQVDEVSCEYFLRASRLRLPPTERLVFFANQLENANRLVAEDAYLEFAHAPYAQVLAMANQLPHDKLAVWLSDPNVPEHRKGFYGLALGMAQDRETRRTNAAHLRALILAPEDDFRAGFDGLLAGYLLLDGFDALELIETRYLRNPTAAVGDVRHALSALRFYHEHGTEISPERLGQAVVPLLARPEFAEAVITDLARWQAWEPLAEVAALFDQPGHVEAGTRRAIVGYLLACPLPTARAALQELRAQHPEEVAGAESVLSRTGSLPVQQ